MGRNCITKFFEKLKKIKLKLFNVNVLSTKGDNSPIVNGNKNVYKK